ncbi:MAG: fluoride efflux transporter CrcB [Deltaproteobacteria bacterium]|nr:fluoride efflux transporter CrcB [Deltaproteobacteria bacterium]
MVGGGMGAVCRYSISLLAVKYLGTRFPWGTLFANLVGCFLIGIIFALIDRTRFLSPLMRLFFMTGFLGALTTFSTYALETVQAVRTGSNFTAVINFTLNNIGCIVLVLAGMWIMQYILKEI